MTFDRLRKEGYCKQHYSKMMPLKFKILVVDSVHRVQNLDEHLEILFRLLLLLFAKNPDTFAVVHSQLKVVAVEYGYMGANLLNERLMTPKMYLALMNNEKVCYQNISINIMTNACF